MRVGESDGPIGKGNKKSIVSLARYDAPGTITPLQGYYNPFPTILKEGVVKMSKMELITSEKFGNIRCDFYNDGKDIWLTRRQIGEALEYGKPNDAITDIHMRHKARLDQFSTTRKLRVVEGSRAVTREMVLYSAKGVYEVCRWSQQPKADAFFDFVYELLERLRKGELQVTSQTKPSKESLSSINNTAKILLSVLKQAGCAPKIQLLTIKSLYEKSGVMLPIEIEAGKQYYDTKHIARQCGMYTKSGNPAYKAVGEIAKKLELREDQFTDTWEAKGNWEGTVRKYDDSVIAAIKEWLEKNGKPEHIEYQQSDGQIKNYHVCYKLLGKEVA